MQCGPNVSMLTAMSGCPGLQLLSPTPYIDAVVGVSLCACLFDCVCCTPRQRSGYSQGHQPPDAFCIIYTSPCVCMINQHCKLLNQFQSACECMLIMVFCGQHITGSGSNMLSYHRSYAVLTALGALPGTSCPALLVHADHGDVCL